MQKIFFTTRIYTPLGEMVTIADFQNLYLLEFFDWKGLSRAKEYLQEKFNAKIVDERTAPIDTIERELELYFLGKLEKFRTPLFISGTQFQQRVWNELRGIPYGQTRSYAQLAIAVGNPAAFRAVALANASNRFALVIPCHRVINTGGSLGGYGGGLERKKWLLEFEQKMAQNRTVDTATI